MRMLKKLLLAGAFIGVLGSFGFAQEAKAAAVTIKPASGTSDKSITISGNVVSANTVKIEIGGVVLDLGSATALSQNGVTVDVKAKVNETINATDKISSDTVDKVTAIVCDKNGAELAKSDVYNLTDKLYKVSAITSTGGSVKVGTHTATAGSTQSNTAWEYGYKDDSISLAAEPGSGYKFDKWTPVPPFGQYATGSIKLANAAAGPYTASFVSKPEYNGLTLNARVVRADGQTTIKNYEARYDETLDINMQVNQYIIFTSSASKQSGINPSGHTYAWDSDYWTDYFREVTSYTGSGKAYRATAEDFDEGFTAFCTYDGSDYSKSFNINVSGIDPVVSTTKINLSDFKDYITEGYTLEFKAKAASDSVNLANQNTKLVISDGSDYVDSIEKTENTSDKNVTFKIKFKGEKLDKGTNSKDIKFKILVGGDSGSPCPIDSDSETEKKVTVYSNPTNSYNNSDRTMSYKVPAKVNTGTESGKDSNLSYTQDTVSDVKGIRINVLLNDNILGTTTTASGKGTGATVDATTMESIITNLGNSGKFTGDCTVVFRAYPSDGSGNCNKKVYHDTYAKVYKVVLKPGQSATAGAKTASAYALPIAMIAQRNTGATTTTATTTTAAGKEYVLYGLEGQTLTAPAGVTDLVDANGNAVTKIVVSADANKNVYTYAATASAATKEGLDKVPKTGQNNVFVYVMAVVVCGAVGYGLYVYNKKSKRSI